MADVKPITSSDVCRHGGEINFRPGFRFEVPPGMRFADYLAKKCGFGSDETYRRAKTVVHYGCPELIAAMDAETLSIRVCADIAALDDHDLQRHILTLPKKEIVQLCKDLREFNANQRRGFEEITVTLKLSGDILKMVRGAAKGMGKSLAETVMTYLDAYRTVVDADENEGE